MGREAALAALAALAKMGKLELSYSSGGNVTGRSHCETGWQFLTDLPQNPKFHA